MGAVLQEAIWRIEPLSVPAALRSSHSSGICTPALKYPSADPSDSLDLAETDNWCELRVGGKRG